MSHIHSITVNFFNRGRFLKTGLGIKDGEKHFHRIGTLKTTSNEGTDDDTHKHEFKRKKTSVPLKAKE